MMSWLMDYSVALLGMLLATIFVSMAVWELRAIKDVGAPDLVLRFAVLTALKEKRYDTFISFCPTRCDLFTMAMRDGGLLVLSRYQRSMRTHIVSRSNVQKQDAEKI